MAAPEQKVLFILGGGPRIGHGVAKKFLSQGYKVAIGRRHTDKVDLDGVLPVHVDVTKDETIEAAFKEVESKLGIPTIVVYNIAALTFPPENDPFGVDPAIFARDLTINVGGAYTALHHATRLARGQGGPSNPGPRPLVFIATGNVTPFQPLDQAVTLGPGKAGLAHLTAIGKDAYAKDGFRFYFASQVTESGGPVPYPYVDGEAHGEAYWRLVEGELEGWDVRFTAANGSATFR
ncbi:hypothetical protein VTK26DRAFT_1533 [Humicola hyalothermophila]